MQELADYEAAKSQELERFKAEQSQENQLLKEQLAKLAEDKKDLKERNKSLQERNKSIPKSHKGEYPGLSLFSSSRVAPLLSPWLLIVSVFKQSSKSC